MGQGGKINKLVEFVGGFFLAGGLNLCEEGGERNGNIKKLLVIVGEM